MCVCHITATTIPSQAVHSAAATLRFPQHLGQHLAEEPRPRRGKRRRTGEFGGDELWCENIPYV